MEPYNKFYKQISTKFYNQIQSQPQQQIDFKAGNSLFGRTNNGIIPMILKVRKNTNFASLLRTYHVDTFNHFLHFLFKVKTLYKSQYGIYDKFYKQVSTKSRDQFQFQPQQRVDFEGENNFFGNTKMEKDQTTEVRKNTNITSLLSETAEVGMPGVAPCLIRNPLLIKKRFDGHMYFGHIHCLIASATPDYVQATRWCEGFNVIMIGIWGSLETRFSNFNPFSIYKFQVTSFHKFQDEFLPQISRRNLKSTSFNQCQFQLNGSRFSSYKQTDFLAVLKPAWPVIFKGCQNFTNTCVC